MERSSQNRSREADLQAAAQEVEGSPSPHVVINRTGTVRWCPQDLDVERPPKTMQAAKFPAQIESFIG